MRQEALYMDEEHLRYVPLDPEDEYSDIKSFIVDEIFTHSYSEDAFGRVFTGYSCLMPDLDENGVEKAIYMVVGALYLIENNEVSHYRFYEAYKDSLDILSGNYDDCFPVKSELEAFKVDIAKLMEYLDQHPEYKVRPENPIIRTPGIY